MLQDFDKSQFQALTEEQKNQIKGNFDLIPKILKGNNSTNMKNFLFKYWDDYFFVLYKIYTQEELDKNMMDFESIQSLLNK